MKRILVIFNPVARGERSQRLRRFLDSIAQDRVTLAPTRCAGDATLLAAEAAAENCDVIVAAGGDGTINEVVNGLIGSTTALGILPLGTVNVFAKELCLPSNTAAAWRVLEAGHTRTIDLGCAEAAGKRRYFVQLAGVGFDARAVRAASWELKKRIGPLSYVWAGLKTLAGNHPLIEISLNGSAPTARGVAALVGNGRFYGGKFVLFPTAKLDDGLLDVCVFETFTGFDLLKYGQGILRGAHPQMSGVKYFQATEFTCQSNGLIPFEVDGEDAGDGPVKFSVQPAGLRVIVPLGRPTQGK